MTRFNLGALIELSTAGSRTLLIDCRDQHAAQHWTGARIEAEADAVARGLARRGLARGDRVAILAANRAEYMTVYLGIMRAGLVAVPVNIKLAPQTIHYVLRDSGAKLAFVDRDREALNLRSIPAINLDADSFPAFLDPGEFEPTRPRGDEVAMILYTSGSTGKPKGVPLTHRGHLWVIEQRFQPGVDYARERILVAAPLYHMNALAITKFAWAAGATVVLLPQFTATAYIDAIARFGCTWLTSVPTMLALVVQQRERLAGTDLSSVTSVRMGSAPVTQKLLAQVRSTFPGARVQIGYGTTEAGPVAFGPHPDGLATPELALGYPHRAVDIRLKSATGGASVTDHGVPEQGVLEMRCPAVTPGYHNLEPKTASVFSADGYYHTGDVMRRDANGFYYFVGRDDDMFVCNGENVFPEEVERLLESHPEVVQACVVPVEDEVRGQMPVAFVVARDTAARLDVEALKQYCLANGPAYQHPRRIFIAKELPLAGTNKVDRRKLIELAEAAPPAPGHRIESGAVQHTQEKRQ